jgi:acyl-CoA thioesterase I
MSRTIVPALLFLLATALPAAAAERCAAKADFTHASSALPEVAAAMKPGATLDILAIGSATILAPTTGQPGTAFPYRMVEALEAAEPGVTFRLTVRGEKGMTAAAMLELMRDALSHDHYPLVIWQSGTVEAAHKTPVAEFARTLAAGAALVRRSGGDLVLVDPQFSRFLRNHSDLAPYERAFEEAAGQPGVLLFRRYDLMRSWAEADQIDLERTAAKDRDRMADTLHACLGRSLADLVLNGAGAAHS